VVVTGIGVVAPNGIGKTAFWRASVEGIRSIGPIRRFDASGHGCRVAGQVEDLSAADFVGNKVLKQTDRSTHMALACCRMATEDAALALDREDPTEIGMYFASVFGGMDFAEPELHAQTYLGPGRVSAYQSIAWFYAATQGQWSIAAGIRGFGKSIVGDRAGGLQAVLLAALAIRRGHCAAAYAGGSEAPLVPYTFWIHESTGMLSTRNDAPERAYRPFDADRSGLVLGEGSGVLLLEDHEHALARGAHIYAEVAGGSMLFDGGSPPTLTARCIAEAVRDANIEPAQVGLVLAEGLALREADHREACAIYSALGGDGRAPAVSVPKAAIGHTLAAAGAIDAIWAALMLHERVLLPTPGAETPDCGAPVNLLVGAPQEASVDTILCLASGSSGVNAALIMKRYEP
jgi:3-oxoacyl-(acyl-carrier-protein) synthase